LGDRRWVASSSDWATGVFRVAVAPGVGCGPPAPAVVLTAVETRRPWDGPPVESRVPSPAVPPVWSGMPLRRVGVAARLRPR
jgi:hypothetical protein